MEQKLAIVTVIIALTGLMLVPVYALISLPYYSSTIPDGTSLSNIPEYSESFAITGLINYMQNENLNINNLYFKVIVPNDNDNEWNLSKELMERKPTVVLVPYPYSGNYSDTPTGLAYRISGEPALAFACCNITKGDLLYTANASNPDGSFNITLAGTLVNNRGQNWKSRVYNSTTSSWGNVNVGVAQAPDVYNRRAILHSDGVIVGYAMESVNVTVPTLIKIYKV